MTDKLANSILALVQHAAQSQQDSSLIETLKTFPINYDGWQSARKYLAEQNFTVFGQKRTKTEL